METFSDIYTMSRDETDEENYWAEKATKYSFDTEWDDFVEILAVKYVPQLLHNRGIPICSTAQHCSQNFHSPQYSFDIIAENGDTIVVVEVKTTLRPDDVREFLDELDHFKQWLPRYSDMKVYGAVAFLHNVSEAANFAAKKGLFTILATGSSATITNPRTFKPKEF